jgi:small-conductance mechanosensitive channel
MNMLSHIFYGNTVGTWLLALLVVAGVMGIVRLLTSIILHRLNVYAKKTATDVDDFIADLLKRTKWLLLLLLSLYAATFIVQLPEKAEAALSTIAVLALLIQAAIWAGSGVTFWLNRYRKRKLQEDPATATTFSALGFVIRLALWSVVLLLILDNLGIDITALVTGLGIGGIAVALAVQNILGDLFASLSIVLDKPFVIGDFIIVGDLLGTVEKIGLKTTRVRSLSGEQLVFSNTDLLQSRIRNYKRMFERRVLFSFGVIYQTSHEQLSAIPGMVKEIVEEQELARFDRAHFKEYGNFSLNFEVVYYVRNPDYNLYMDTQQAINLALYRRFQEEGIEFAYPTQTLFINREGAQEEAGTGAQDDAISPGRSHHE